MRQMESLPRGAAKIVIDNASVNADEIGVLLEQFAETIYVRQSTNIGLAAGLNLGLRAASKLADSAAMVLLLDQDSVPEVGSVETLLEAFDRLERGGENVGCVGPVLLDRSTGLQHGFHRMVGPLWRRSFPKEDSGPLRCSNINGSGTVFRLALFSELGGLDESLFIDHVDTEWAFRVQAAGYTLWGIPDARFQHNMGLASKRFWFLGWRVWPVREPARHLLLFRNAARLMKRGYVPRIWKLWAAVKLALTMVATMIFGPKRLLQIEAMISGIREGIAR